jgi:hypothetical protein
MCITNTAEVTTYYALYGKMRRQRQRSTSELMFFFVSWGVSLWPPTKLSFLGARWLLDNNRLEQGETLWPPKSEATSLYMRWQRTFGICFGGHKVPFISIYVDILWYRAGSTGRRYDSTSKGSRLALSRSGIKTSCFEAICFINLWPNHKIC